MNEHWGMCLHSLGQSGLPTRKLWAERSKCLQISICSTLRQLKCQEVVLENIFLGLPWSINLAVHCKWFSPAEFTLVLNSIMMALCHCYVLCSNSVHFSAEMTTTKASLQHLSNFGKTCWSLLFFNPGGIKERPKSYHKMLTKYHLHTKLPQTALGLMGSWIRGLLVKTLSMHWKTQMLCILTVPFLLTLLKGQLIIAGSSKPPYRQWTLNKQQNSCRSVTISFLVFIPKLFNWTHESSSIPCW